MVRLTAVSTSAPTMLQWQWMFFALPASLTPYVNKSNVRKRGADILYVLLCVAAAAAAATAVH